MHIEYKPNKKKCQRYLTPHQVIEQFKEALISELKAHKHNPEVEFEIILRVKT